jgi:hypothetical protein
LWKGVIVDITNRCVFERVPVHELTLDTKNPRIAKWVEMYGDNITIEHMRLALGFDGGPSEEGGTTFYSLQESIKTNGGIIHPIIVNRESGGRLAVIEGNTRTLIYREFLKQGIEGDWAAIPAMVYEALSEKDIDAIRLQAHLVGPRAWDPYSKAKYLELLRNSAHLTFAQLVDFCGGRKREVQDYIAAYRDMEDCYRPLLESDDQFDATRFSAFVELQKGRLREPLLKARFTKQDFAGWVRDGLFAPLQTVRQLPQILENPKSKEVFLRDGAQEAIKVLDLPAPDEALKNATLEHLAREVTRRVLDMSYSDLQRLRTDLASAENAVLCNARDQLTQLCADIASEE